MCEPHYRLALEIEKRVAEGRAGLAQIGKNGRVKGGPGSGKGAGAGGPPAITNDEATIKRIRELGGLQCTISEVAGVLQCHEETVRAFFQRHEKAARAFHEGRENGKASLRRMQFVQAKRSAAMGIWLGKNYLGQRDSDPGSIDRGSLSDEIGNEESATALLRAVRDEIE
jgi:hypothetical protein